MSSDSWSAAARPLSARAVRVWITSALALTAIHVLRLLGDLSESGLALLTVGAVGTLVVALLRNRPPVPGPWIAIIAAAVLFSAGAITREQMGTTGDLSEDRSLVPDFFTMPGYIMLIVALVWLLKLRNEQLQRPGVGVDATLIALGSFVGGWTVLIDPTFSTRDAAPIATAAVSVYPIVSVFLVSIAARLAFGPGERSPSHRFLVGGMAVLLVGDFVYFFTDTGVINPPGRFVDLPYCFTYTLITAAAVHPSMRAVAHPLSSSTTSLQRSRLAFVAFALTIPALVMPLWSPSNVLERVLIPAALGAMVAVAVARMVIAASAQSRSEARFAHLATHDQLTGLPNRLHVYEHVETLARTTPEGRQIAIVYLDIDRFRLVNDSLGHQTGDRLLRAAASRLQLVTRPGDLVARISGDEFVVVAADVDEADATALAERLRAAFENALDIGTEHHITVSVGVAQALVRPGTTLADPSTGLASDLTRDADTAMYRSKDRGGNAVTVFDDSMREQMERRLTIESDLRRSLARGELEVHYQPIVSLITGAIEGFEALARWRRGDEWISPMEFISVAEESGLILPLGEWVLSEACDQLRRWRELPGCEHLTISVNVSPRQLRSIDVPRMVHDTLQASNLDGNALWLEITESSMVLDTSDTAATFEALHRMGARICVDDFGTGFSSLSYLQKFAIDRLKIDRSFVVAMASGAQSRSLVSAILAIARTLRIDVVAEGVETEDQAENLIALGCRGAQGYLYGKPAPPSNISMLLGQRV